MAAPTTATVRLYGRNSATTRLSVSPVDRSGVRIRDHQSVMSATASHGSQDTLGVRIAQPASWTARRITASIMSGVSLPVNVFCWLRVEPTHSRYGPMVSTVPWPNRGLGPGGGYPASRAPEARRPKRTTPGRAAPWPGEQPELAHQERQAALPLLWRGRLPGGAHLLTAVT